jgi:hypothetical protein
MRLLIEAIYLKYSYDFAITPALRSSAGSCTRCASSTAHGVGAAGAAARPGHVHAAAAVPDDPGQRCSATPATSWRCARKCRCAHLALDQDLDRRLQHGRGGVFHGHPAARGGPAGAHHHLCHRHQPALAGKAKQGIYSLQSMREYAENYRRPVAGATSPSTTPRPTATPSWTAACATTTFADHSLATDSVSETHLVSCRNVLIYFNKTCRTAPGPVPRVAVPPRLPGAGQQGVGGFRPTATVSSRWSA